MERFRAAPFLIFLFTRNSKPLPAKGLIFQQHLPGFSGILLAHSLKTRLMQTILLIAVGLVLFALFFKFIQWFEKI